MEVLLIRHAQTDGKPLSEVDGPELSEFGRAQARGLRGELTRRGIDVSTVAAAVSALLRARQTAADAGLVNTAVYPLLNEVNTADPSRTPKLLDQGLLPEEALAAADALLRDPPRQQIWVTHGLVMMGLLERLGMTDPEHFVPGYCQVIPIQIPDL